MSQESSFRLGPPPQSAVDESYVTVYPDPPSQEIPSDESIVYVHDN
jgi:hypothetical protein